ncbi:OsmC-like protein [Cristinia sonorae]|uniref:OsmC-like protein n=1 Tax=Cristinia sonorae TaxID=1940300 RepID=A0A8K0V2A9_9AGAR|nr:OsmC-like protein [Cristinia sonorae]
MIATRVLCRPFTSRVMNGTIMKDAVTKGPTFPRYGHNHLMGRGASELTLKDHVYFSKATASGAGRNGIVESNGDKPLKLVMDTPKAAGGKGEGQNPEQLFAMGYSACFLGALQLAASRVDKRELVEQAKVNAAVFLGHPEDPNMDGFGLRVELTVEGCDDDAIISAAHEFCPYSRALTQGADVKVLKL